MEKFKKFVPYLIIVAAAFYFVPLIPVVFPQSQESIGVGLMLFLAIPLANLISAVVFGFRHGMNFLYIVFVFVIYLPQIIYYRSVPVAVVGFIYLIFTFIGLYTGPTVNSMNRIKKDENKK